MNPTGPEDPSVYWRRRLLVGLGALVVLIIFFLLLRSCSSDPEPVATPVPTPTVVEPSSSASAVPAGSCSDADIAVAVEPKDSTSFPTGTPITFTMQIKNTSSEACDRDVGTLPNTVLVETGGGQVWSSDDCSPPGSEDIKTMDPGEVLEVNATWDQKQTLAGCPAGQPSVSAGSYDVIAVNEQVTSTPTPFSIT